MANEPLTTIPILRVVPPTREKYSFFATLSSVPLAIIHSRRGVESKSLYRVKSDIVVCYAAKVVIILGVAKRKCRTLWIYYLTIIPQWRGAVFNAAYGKEMRLCRN